MIGGQYLQGSTQVFVSGDGVMVKVVRYSVKHDPKRLNQFYRNRENAKAAQEGKTGKALEKEQRRIAQAEQQIRLTEVPEGVDLFNKKEVQKYYRFNSKEQFNPQIADRLRVDITIATNAPAGVRELRVYTAKGLSNPIYFDVGVLDEIQEAEPNDDHMDPTLPLIPVPSMINGNIDPGDVDHFRFKAQKGQSIVVDVGARKITPYLADAVPGWFQAVVALYDEEGNEVAYQDDYKFNPDPVLFFDVPVSGIYTLSIKDSIYRGREDFIYRIAIGELPFITSIFPLGSEQGREVNIALSGKNLPQSRVTGKLPENGYQIRNVSVKTRGVRSNPMPFAIGELQETFETEPNGFIEEAQRIEKPILINGRIQEPGDHDVFKFQGTQGDFVAIEVLARRLNSPLDSVITLSGPGIKKPIRVDDYVDHLGPLFLGSGLVTHHADSYLLKELPETGTYYVDLTDNQMKGGPDYGYRLRISPANPDFKLSMEPSGLPIAPGGTVAFTVRTTRLDGYDQPIKLEVKNLPVGFEMSKATIPADSDMTRFTITAPLEFLQESISPEITGWGLVNGSSIERTARPVDDTMQAFLYRHLVPAQELVLTPVEQRPAVSFELKVPATGVIELPLGKEVRIQLTGHLRGLTGAKLKLDHAPDGFTVVKGWIGRKKAKGKTADGKPKYVKNAAWGSIILKAEEPLKSGFNTSLILVAEVRKGKEITEYPAPSITVKVVEALKD
jgi:hypothetical protein